MRLASVVSSPALRHAAPPCRSFSSSSAALAKSADRRLAAEHEGVPPYPHGASAWYKQSNFGLYARQKIRFGNRVSEKHEVKTRRTWKPNVHRKRLWSAALGRFLQLKVTARALRTIDKAGGLDEYLLGEKPGRIKDLGMAGWKLRWRIMQTEVVQERFRQQREELGLPPLPEDVAVGADGELKSMAEIREEVREFDAVLDQDPEVEVGLEDDLAPAKKL